MHTNKILYSLFFILSFSFISTFADEVETDWDAIAFQIEQINQELEQDPDMLRNKRIMDGELFIGCNPEGAQDSLSFFIKKLEELNKYKSKDFRAKYKAHKGEYYQYARKAARYAQHLNLDSRELIKLYNKIEQLFKIPQDTIASLCFDLEKTRIDTNRHLDLGDYTSYELTKYLDSAEDAKASLLQLFWPSAFFFGRFNSAPYILQLIASKYIEEEDYKNTFYYVDRALTWYRIWLRDYDGQHNVILCQQIKESAYDKEKQANDGNAGYALLSTKADMSIDAKAARSSAIPFFSFDDILDVVAAYFYRELALDYIAENNFDLGTYYLKFSIKAFNNNEEFLGTEDKKFQSHNYLVLSNAYEQMGDIDNAINYLQEGISLYTGEKSENQNYKMTHLCMLLNLANLYFDSNRTLSAYKTMQTLDKIWNEEGNINFDFIPPIGITYTSRDQIVGAITTLCDYANARRNISKGNLKEAEFTLKNNLAKLELYKLSSSNLKPTYTSCLVDVLILQNNLEEAQKYLDDILTSNQSNAQVSVLVHSFIQSAKLDLLKGDEVSAAKKCTQALALIKDYITSTLLLLSEPEREKFYGTIENDINELIAICTSHNISNNHQFANILADISLMSKGILLSSSNYIKYIVNNSNDKRLKKLYEKIKELREREAVLSSESSGDNNPDGEINRLEFELLNQPIIKSAIANWSSFVSPSLKQIQSSLKDGEIAIDFIKLNTEIESHSLLLDDQLYFAIIIDNTNQPIFIPISNGNSLSIELDNLTPKVCDIVWEPLKDYIKDAHTVYFSPIGVLNNLPLENLSDIINLNNTKLLRISSLRELALDKSISSKSKAILFGGINYNTGASEVIKISQDRSSNKRAFSLDEASRAGISPLQHTMAEVNGIKNSMNQLGNKSISVVVRSEDKATEQYLRSLDNSDLNILHFATHGFYYEDENNQMSPKNLILSSGARLSTEDKALNRTGLFLAGANANFKNIYLNPNDDGILTAREIADLYFPDLDLVVLSACKTGLGDIKEDGVYGLQRGFKKAGAKTILMSLWEVNDLATSMLVQEFYKAWLETGSQSKALLIAQNKVKNFNKGSNNFSNPFYWAGFVLLDAVN